MSVTGSNNQLHHSVLPVYNVLNYTYQMASATIHSSIIEVQIFISLQPQSNICSPEITNGVESTRRRHTLLYILYFHLEVLQCTFYILNTHKNSVHNVQSKASIIVFSQTGKDLHETNIIFLIKDLATTSYVWALILHIDYKYYEHRDYEQKQSEIYVS